MFFCLIHIDRGPKVISSPDESSKLCFEVEFLARTGRWCAVDIVDASGSMERGARDNDGRSTAVIADRESIESGTKLFNRCSRLNDLSTLSSRSGKDIHKSCVKSAPKHTHRNGVVKSHKEVRIVANLHGQVHLNAAHGDKRPRPPLLVVAEDISQL